MKRIINKLIPSKIKSWIKLQVGSTNSKTVEYIINESSISDIKDKAVLVTGATGAIGSAICQKLYIHGAVIGVSGRNSRKISDLIEKIHKNTSQSAIKGKLIPIIIDVSDADSIENGVDEFLAKVGKIDVVVNNAGGSARSDSQLFHLQSVDIIDDVISVNLRGTMLCSRKVAQQMVNQNYGKIINMASVVGMNGKKRMSDYAMTKAAIIGFTKSLAIELGEFGITVNCVSPGMVNQSPFDAGSAPVLTDTNCLKRYGYTDEVADLIVFLISNKSNYITGHNFVIDGGRSLGLMGDA